MTRMKPVERVAYVDESGVFIGPLYPIENEEGLEDLASKGMRLAHVRITEIPKRWTKRQHQILSSLKRGWVLRSDGPSTFLFGPRGSAIGYEIVFRNTVQPLIDAGEVEAAG